MKKIWIIFLSVLLLAASATMEAQSGSGDGYDYSVNAGGVTITITNYTGSDTAVIIPADINGLLVTSIGTNALADLASLTNVTIAGSVTNIGTTAFSGCTNLTGVYFQGNAPAVGSNVFEFDSNATAYYLPGAVGWGSNFAGLPTMALQFEFTCTTNADNTLTLTGYTGPGGTLTIPTNINGLPVTSIGTNALAELLSLTNVMIPGIITNIGDYAFSDCTNLTGVYFQGNVPAVGSNVFENDTNATVYYLPGAGGWGSNFAGLPTMAEAATPFIYTINPDGITVTLTGYTGPGGAVTIPTKINGLIVTSIGEQAFFENTSLTKVMIGTNVASIGVQAFEGCTNLTAITVVTQNLLLTSLNGVLFNKNKSTLIQYPGGLRGSYSFPGGVTNIGDYAFTASAGLTTVTISASVTNIGEEAFAACTSMTGITVNTGNSFYGSLSGVLFNKSRTTLIQHPGKLGGSYTIPGTVTSISDGAFASCHVLTSVIIPSSVTNIGADAFSYCYDLTGVTIPNKVPRIGADAFYDCAKLISVTIGTNVTSLGDDAFAHCQNLTGVYFEGNVPAVGTNVFEFDTNAMVYYLPGTTGWSSLFDGLTAAFPTGLFPGTMQPGSLTVTLLPAAAMSAGAQWQVDDITNQNSGDTVTNLSQDIHTLSFTPIAGYNTPSNQSVTITSGVTTLASGIYTPSNAPPDSLILITNGYGTIHHGAWPESLVIGKAYRVTAAPQARNVFSGWVGGTSQPYSVLSAKSPYTFTMEPGLVLEANFATNIFLAARGAYKGLFAPLSSPRQPANSGSFSFNVTSSGTISGSLDLNRGTIPFSGKFDLGGTANLVSRSPSDEPTLFINLQLDFADQWVSGIVSNKAFTAALNGARNVFGGSQKATEFEGQYTLIIPGTNNPANGPFGVSYGSVKVNPSGSITLAGSLADGNAISQSSVVSRDGYWPLYLSVARESLWGWTYFTNHTLTAPVALSWVGTTNTIKTAVYRAGFTNQQVMITGGLYDSTSELPSNLTATLEGGGLPFAITNGVTVAVNDKITLTNVLDETNKLKLTLSKSTGVVSGSFANPTEPRQTIKVHGVILQSQTNAQGYFLGTRQSGTFTLDPQ